MVRVGIIGVGYWGPNLVRNFFQLPNCEVVRVCDISKKQLSAISRQFPSIAVTEKLEEVIDDPTITAVVIATPSDTHASLTNRALHKQKHVFVEKPFTLSVLDAQKLVQLNRQKKQIIMVGHTYEYHPAILQMKEYIQKKMLGKIYYLYCSRLNLGKVREETNALWNLAPHDVSILIHLLGTMPLAVSAFGQAYLQKKLEDVVFVQLRFPKNIIAHIHVSWLDPSKERKLTIVGSKKMIVFDDLDNEGPLRIYEKGFERVTKPTNQPVYKEFSLKLRPGDIKLPFVESAEPLRLECAHFIDCIEKNEAPQSNELNGLRTVQVLEAAQRSLQKKGVWIPLN